jgi:hypothetical protein
MRITKRNRAIAHRAQWLAEFERIVIEARPDLAGRFNWNTPVHMFNTGMSAPDAAARFIASPDLATPRPENPQVATRKDDSNGQ